MDARMKRSAASCTRRHRKSWGSCLTVNQMRATWRMWTYRKMRSVSHSKALVNYRFHIYQALSHGILTFSFCLPTAVRWHKVWKVNRSIPLLHGKRSCQWLAQSRPRNEGHISPRGPRPGPSPQVLALRSQTWMKMASSLVSLSRSPKDLQPRTLYSKTHHRHIDCI